MNFIIGTLLGFAGATVMYFYMSAVSPKVIPIPEDDPPLAAAKKCILNNTVKGNNNLLTIIDIATLSIESIVVTKLAGNDLFQDIENCTSGLSSDELKELSKSDEVMYQNMEMQRINRLIIGL